CCYPAVSGGEIAEVEDKCLCRLRQKPGNPFMTGKYELHPLVKPGLLQSLSCLFNGALLEIEGQHPPGLTCKLRQENGVLTVPAGGIDNQVSCPDALPEKKVRQRNCTVKSF